MDPLPMAPSCALDEAGLRLQLDRYRRAGRGASLVGRTSRRLVVELDQHVDASLVEAAIAVERECCPFFVLDWHVATRRLTVSVAEAEHEPALDGIAFALGVEESACRVASERRAMLTVFGAAAVAVKVPHYVAVMPSEIAADATTVEEVIPRFGSCLFIEVEHSSPQVAQVLAARRDD